MPTVKDAAQDVVARNGCYCAESADTLRDAWRIASQSDIPGGAEMYGPYETNTARRRMNTVIGLVEQSEWECKGCCEKSPYKPPFYME